MKNYTRKSLALALVILLLASALPLTAFAGDEAALPPEREAIDWLAEQYITEGATVRDYFYEESRINASGVSLNSTGKNFGEPVCGELADALGIDQDTPMLWRIWRQSPYGEAGEVNIFFSWSAPGTEAGAPVENVTRHTLGTDVYASGSAKMGRDNDNNLVLDGSAFVERQEPPIGEGDLHIDNGDIVIGQAAGQVTVTQEGKDFSAKVNENVLEIGQLSEEAQPYAITVEDGVSGLILVLTGLNLDAGTRPARELEARPALALRPGAEVTIELVEENTMSAGEGYAALEVGYEGESHMAKLTITGSGSLSAQGGANAAGIGGSHKDYTTGEKTEACVFYGDILIDCSGSVTARGGKNGAGIGSAGNNARNSGGTASYPMDAKAWGSISVFNGTVDAAGGANAAGIGGGSHMHGSGEGGGILIAGGQVSASGSAGIGSGLGSHTIENGKGPGSYHSGRIEITGGVVAAESTGNGAGIGGGMYADGDDILISGGSVTARGGDGSANTHHGGAGIGGGYEGHGHVRIEGGEVEAYGQVAAAGIGSGGSPNRKPDRKEDDPKYARSEDSLDLTIVEITGGLVTAAGGPMGGAGIGAGAGADQCEVRISGGEVKAWGSSSAREEMWGGAGIGSGAYLASDSYHTPTVTEVSISGNAEVIATGGWGAAGAGSGAENQRADVRIADGGAQIIAYADGTKFALDTKEGSGDDTVSFPQRISDSVLQGTFVNLDSRRYEGLNVELRPSDKGAALVSLGLPQGYRSFAATLDDAGTYLVYSADAAAEGWYVHNTVAPHEFRENDGEDANTFDCVVAARSLSDNFYLYLSGKEPDDPDDNGGDGGSDDGGGAPTPEPETPETIIPEPETPLAPEPGIEPAEPSEEMIIVEEETPLGNLPQTGTVPSDLTGGSQWRIPILALLGGICAAALWSGKRGAQGR